MQIKKMVIESLKQQGYEHLFTQKAYNSGYRKIKTKWGNKYWMAMQIADYILFNYKE